VKLYKALRWGMLAPGLIANQIASDFQLAGIQIQAAGSRNIASAQAFAEKWSIPTAHGSYEELVADPAVDIIYISSPQTFHAPHALLALEAGKHVLVEKPFTINAKETAQLIEAARRNHVFLMEAMWTRFLPSMQRVMELVRSGAIGEVRTLIADHDQYLPASKVARLHSPELGGGSILDLGVYVISFASSLFGKPTNITARGVIDSDGLDEAASMIFEYEGGAQALLHSSMMAAGPVTASVIGTKGRIEMEHSFYEHCAFTVYDNDEKVIERYEGKIEGRGMQFQGLEVERQIAASQLESQVMSLAESLEILETMDEVRRQIGVKYPSELGI
jgi:predicted dehydrogenase